MLKAMELQSESAIMQQSRMHIFILQAQVKTTSHMHQTMGANDHGCSFPKQNTLLSLLSLESVRQGRTLWLNRQSVVPQVHRCRIYIKDEARDSY